MGYFLRAAFQNGSAALLFPSSGGGIYVPQSHPSILSGGREGIVYLRFSTTFVWKWSCWFCFFDGNILRCFFQLDLKTPLFTVKWGWGQGDKPELTPPLLSVSCFQFRGQIRPRSGLCRTRSVLCRSWKWALPFVEMTAILIGLSCLSHLEVG